MKKILSLVLALLMMLGCTALAEDLTGAWYGNLFGMSVTLTLNADGTYGMDLMDETQTGVWVLEGETLYMDKGTDMETILAYDAAAVTLTMDMDGMVFVFSREAAAAFVPVEPKTDAAIEEFAGQWEAANVYFMDMLVPTEFAEMGMTLKIENTSINASIDLMGDVETFEAEGKFADGVLTLVIPATLDEAGNELTRELVFPIKVLQDGTLSFEMDMLGMPIIFYLNPAVAEEAAA